MQCLILLSTEGVHLGNEKLVLVTAAADAAVLADRT